MDQGGIDDGALTQRQPPIARVTIDQSQNPSRQLVRLQQVTEIANGGFIGYALQASPGKLAEDRGLVQRLLHSRTAVAEPALHQMYAHHRHQQILTEIDVMSLGENGMGAVGAVGSTCDRSRSESLQIKESLCSEGSPCMTVSNIAATLQICRIRLRPAPRR